MWSLDYFILLDSQDIRTSTYSSENTETKEIAEDAQNHQILRGYITAGVSCCLQFCIFKETR